MPADIGLPLLVWRNPLIYFFVKEIPLPFPVSLNRSGIPRCIPSFHRKMIMKRDVWADKLVRFYLSMFLLSKLILVRKRGSFGYEI